MADYFLTEGELRAMAELKRDVVRLTRRNHTILDVIALLEEALEENQELRQRIAELEKR